MTDPGRPTISSPVRFLMWLARQQISTILFAMSFGTIWMLAQALAPALLGRAIDDGVVAKDTGALVLWSLSLLGLGLAGAIAGILRHRAAVSNWLTAAYRVQQLLTRKAVELGGTLQRRVATGEVVSIGASDLEHFGSAMDVMGRFAGAVISLVVVAVILLSTSVPLGLVVLLGVPLLLLLVAPVLKPLHARQSAQREQVGELATVASDIVMGLRVLRGIGGEDVFGGRYRRDSARVRDAGIAVARVRSLLEASNVLLPGIFVLVVVWLGATFAVRGEISAGELVAFYGYAAFLVTPLRTITETAQKMTRALVAARRATNVLRLQPEIAEPRTVAAEPPALAELVDSTTGLVVRPGVLTVRRHQPADRDRAHSPSASDGTSTPTTASASRLAVSRCATFQSRSSAAASSSTTPTPDSSPACCGTSSTRPVRGPRPSCSRRSRPHRQTDVLEALADGLDAPVEERGRSFSGGQRQRLILVRALLVDPEILVLVEPTSAVDAHTEARIAERLHAARAGRTTVIMSASPLVLDRADEVVLLVDGRVAADRASTATCSPPTGRTAPSSPGRRCWYEHTVRACAAGCRSGEVRRARPRHARQRRGEVSKVVRRCTAQLRSPD